MARSKSFSNTWHPTKNRLGREWWYFTLFCNDGSIIAGNFCVYGGRKLAGDLWLSVYLADGTVREFPRIRARPVRVEQGRVYVAFGENYFSEVDGEYRVFVHEGDLSLQFTGKAGLHWKENVTSFEDGKGSIADWIIPVLKGNFAGSLVLKGRERKINGFFFHEYVFISVCLPFLLSIRGWVWGVTYQDNQSVLFAQCYLKPKPVRFVFVEKNGRVFHPEKYTLQWLKDSVRVTLPSGEVIFPIESLSRVTSFRGKNRFLSFLRSFLGFRKYHAFSLSKKSYIEFLRP